MSSTWAYPWQISGSIGKEIPKISRGLQGIASVWIEKKENEKNSSWGACKKQMEDIEDFMREIEGRGKADTPVGPIQSRT